MWGEGGNRLDIAYLPVRGCFFHSLFHILTIELLARRIALDLDVLYGVCLSRWVASLANSSALSFPWIPQWLGHQDMLILRSG